METFESKQVLHRGLYNSLADIYKQRAFDVLVQDQLYQKAMRLKSLVKWSRVLEIGVGGGQMNLQLARAGFSTMGVDIAENMLANAKHLNPQGSFMHGNYLETSLPDSYDVIVWLAFIHLFDQQEAKQMLLKMYQDLNDGGVLHLTTTKESSYSYQKIEKQDYGSSYLRYRAKYTPETFVDLFSDTPFLLERLAFERGVDGKCWMSLDARKKILSA